MQVKDETASGKDGNYDDRDHEAGVDGGDGEVGEDGEAGRDDEAGGDGEDKKMDDKERMRDLAPVSLWQGGGEGALGTISVRALCAAPTYIHRNALN